MLPDDFTRLRRVELIMGRQAHFIYDLARACEHRATFELRFIASPHPVPGQPYLIDTLMNLNPSQREYAGTLTAGIAILRDPFGRPVHVKAPEPPKASEDGVDDTVDVVDAAIRAPMAVKRAALRLDDVPVVPWDTSLRRRR